MLHITNGSSVGDTLAETRLPGQVALSADVLHEGPCPTGLGAGEFRATRARYLSGAGYATYDDALASLASADAAMDAGLDGDEVVLWFEHDLFDQLQLLRVLAWCARRHPFPAALTLICIGAFPGMARFDGLGQLSAAQLLALFPGRVPVTAAQLHLAVDAWRRFGAEDPRPFAALLDEDTGALPFLEGAVRRQLQELPSASNGLSRTEEQALAVVAAGAPNLARAFQLTQQMEERVFMGDLSFARAVRGLAAAGLPLVRLEPAGDDVPLVRQSVSLTAFGKTVLSGDADHARVNGVDRWIGGVHLQGHEPFWRWDAERGVVGGGVGE